MIAAPIPACADCGQTPLTRTLDARQQWDTMVGIGSTDRQTIDVTMRVNDAASQHGGTHSGARRVAQRTRGSASRRQRHGHVDTCVPSNGSRRLRLDRQGEGGGLCAPARSVAGP